MFEEFTEDYFLSEAKALGDELGIDTRTGSVYMDMAAGHCLRAAFFFANLRELFNMFALDTCYADVLDDKAAEWGLTRHVATSAVFNATFTGTQPIASDRFFDEASGYYFVVTLGDDGTTLMLTAETTGAECNTISAGTEITPVDDIDGLEEAVLGEISVKGEDEESDDALRSRLREKIAGPAENGNRQHYKTWCESVEGVGRARIIPLFAGENTVRAILYSAEGLPCTSEVVAAVQKYIDPITKNYKFKDESGITYICGDGFGDGVANLGAHFLASAPTSLSIAVSFKVTLTDGSSLDECRTAALAAITTYLKSLALESEEGSEVIVRISSIGALITGLSQVLDYSDLTINGGTTNISVSNGYVAIPGEVTVSATS